MILELEVMSRQLTILISLFKAVNSDDEPVDLYIGGSMFLENGTDYIFAVGGVSPYDSNSNQPTLTNTTYFNQTIGTSAIDTLYWGHNGAGNNKIEAEERLELGNFVLDRNSGNELRTIAASNIKNNQIFVDVNGDASVLSGTLDQGRQVFRTWGKIINYDRMGTWYEDGTYPVSGGTPKYAQIRFREDTDLKIITKEGAVFGNIRFNVTPNPSKTPIVLTSDVKIEQMEFMRGAIYLKGYNLTVDRLWNLQGNGESFTDIANSDELDVTDTGINGKKLIYTDGKASDGGLTLYINQDTKDESEDTRNENLSPVTFPIGYTTDGGSTIYHRPAQMKVKGISDDGYITIRPVSGTLQTTDVTGGELLNTYWRVTHSDFTTLPTVAFQFYYRDQIGVTGVDKQTGAVAESNYVPGYVLDEAPYTRVYESNPVSDYTDVVNSDTEGVTRRIVFNGGSTSGEFDNVDFEGFTLINANFTCGEYDRFVGEPQVFYSRSANADGNMSWTNTNDWSLESHTGSAAGDYPKVGDVAIIGHGNTHGNNYHWLKVNSASVHAAVIEFNYYDSPYSGSSYMWNSRLWLNEYASVTAGLVRGRGTISMEVSSSNQPSFIADLGEFNSEEKSQVHYYIDGDDVAMPTDLSEFPNLRIEGRSGNRTAIFSNDLTINKTMRIDGNAHVELNSGLNGDIEVLGDLMVGNYNSGYLNFNESGTERTVTVHGNVRMTDDANNEISVLNNTASGLTHLFKVGGDIRIQTGDFDLFDSGANANNVELEFFGEGDHRFYRENTSTVPELYRVIVNKGSSQEDTISIDLPVVINGPTNTEDKAVELQNGLLVLNESTNTIVLSSGGSEFEIPSTSALEIKQGTATINGGYGMLLDGRLKVSGGTLDMTGGDHPIIYTTSGNSEIEITGGSLLVGSQIRRSKNDDMGVLNFTQTGGDVQIGVSSGGVSSRGMLEILNSGSSFNYTGGDLTLIQQNTNSPEIAALVLDPSSYNLTGSTLNLFNNSTPTGQNAFGINSSISLNNLKINGTNDPVANIKIRDLHIDGDLIIESGATIDAKGFAIDIQGDWTNDGTYKASSGEVVFSGYNAQTITGNTTFYKLTKQGGEDVLLLGNSTDISIDYLLTLTNGSIDDAGNTIFVKRDIVNNGEMISGDGDGVVLNGSLTQRIFGDGTYEKLYLDNTNGFTQQEGNVITIKENLQMENGVLDIGKNLIVFEENAIITTTSGFSTSNLIQTDVSFVDAGLKKYVPSGSLSFTYPLGSGGAYTPVILSVTNNSASGAFLRVKGANECHPSVVDLSSTTMNETTNVLQYYWVLDANGFTDFQGKVSMSYPNSMVMVTESGYSYSDYITARLLDRGTGEWNKDVGIVDTANDILTFDFSVATDDEGIKGDYTAGLDEAIPDQVPTYTSVKDGDWNDISIWTPTPPTGGPRGAIVVVDHNVTIPVDYISSYKTTINDQITINETEGHRLGNVYGTGTLYLETGGLPTADYSEFFLSEGGTVEFSGTDKSYPVLSGITSVNNIKFSGTGQRNLPNTDLTILGDLNIEASGSLSVNNVNDKDLYIEGDIELNSGNIDWGTGALILNGRSIQNISGSGSFTGTNEVYNLNVNNGSGVNLQLDVNVSNILKLTNGIINTEDGSLVITNTDVNAFEGGSSTSFVEGPLAKYINYNESFQFPVGKDGRYGRVKLFNAKRGSSASIGVWEVEYFNSNPSDSEMDVASMSGEVEYVSHNEYWRINSPSTGSTAKLTLRWDEASGVEPDNNFRVVKWTDLDIDAWEELNITNKGTSSSSGTVDLLNTLTFGFSDSNTNHYLTFGSIYIPTYTWLGNTSDWFDENNWGGGLVPSAASDITINTNGEAPEIEVGSIAQVNNLVINHTNGLTLQPGARLTVNGNLTTNDLLKINNTSEFPASLIINGDVKDESEIKWQSLDNSRFWYMGHPVSGQLIPEYNHSLNFEDDVKGYRIYVFDNENYTWNNINSASYNFSAMESVALKVSSEKDLSYRGVLNNESGYSFNALAEGYQTIANPYPSYIDFKSMYDNGEIEGFSPTIYMYASNLGVVTYSAYNAATGDYVNGSSRYISPGQSFWIHTNDDYTTNVISVSKDDCKHVNGGSLKSTSATENKIRLSLKNSNTNDETLISFSDYGKMTFSNYDSEKRMVSGKSGNIYTIKDSKCVAINSLPESSDVEVIPLGYRVAQSGMKEFTIHVNDLSGFEPDVNVYLLDKADKNNVITVNLRENPTYTFTPLATESNDRFELKFVPSVTTDIDDIPSASNKNVSIYAVKQIATVKVSEEVLQSTDRIIYIYNVSGQLVKTGELNKTETTINLPHANTVYIIKVDVDGVSYQNKVVSQN